jgi:hypothetical protein
MKFSTRRTPSTFSAATRNIPDHIGFHHTVELDNTFMDNDFGRAIS